MVKYSICILSLLFLGCKDDKLEMSAQSYTLNNLRLDGYYYNNNPYVKDIYFFYSNGYLLLAYTPPADYSFAKINDRLISTEIQQSYKKEKTLWTYFIISDKDIEHEVWAIGTSNRISRNFGVILNDSTYVINKVKNWCGEESTINDTFRFKQFTPKPDSTNSFL